ncbi:hypothetical protein [Gulosibacter sp. ACHW.36C]|uniref:EcsC family protein n=1 Tax=Gulosibacter sediminis TaxID=1729695 RepID=A0ABY4N2U7_9MICO|nr:hypothetical protein [Gulosibacter sediminis]UQN15848.1 hypothetical protein M3M28_05195 [Gulosibacter sediminis]
MTEPSATERTSSRGDVLVRALDQALRVQRPAALAFARRLRRVAPDATPDDLLRIAEKWYRRTAMGAGGGVGAASAIPGIGTATGIALISAEVVSFLDLTALYALTVAELHGDATDDPDRARALVTGILLGDRGRKLVTEFVRTRAPQTLLKNAAWGELVTEALPQVFVGELGQRLSTSFLSKFAGTHLGGLVGKLLPFGIGAAVGALGNRALANEVIRTADGAFGPAPQCHVGDLSDETLAELDAANPRFQRRQAKLQAKLERGAERKQLRAKKSK